MAFPRTKPYAIILGHSFVQSLQDHFFYIHANTNEMADYESYCARELEVSHKIERVFLVGWRGAKVLPSPTQSYVPFTLPHKFLSELLPEIAILELGSNDIAVGHDPHEVAAAIIGLAQQLRETYKVPVVKICSVLDRDNSVNLTLDEFHDRALLLNKSLSHLAKFTPGISYHNHAGFWRDGEGSTVHPSEWSFDAIHPNNQVGRKLYKKSLKNCLHNAVRTLKQ